MGRAETLAKQRARWAGGHPANPFPSPEWDPQKSLCLLPSYSPPPGGSSPHSSRLLPPPGTCFGWQRQMSSTESTDRLGTHKVLPAFPEEALGGPQPPARDQIKVQGNG